jgi:hypothetical protein
VNVEIQESYLPDLKNAEGENLAQARVKQGAGSRNTGQETSQGRSATRQDGDSAQTQGEQPALYGKVEYDLDGQSVREDYIGQVETNTETTSSSQGDGAQNQNPFEGSQIEFESEGQARVNLEKIGENTDVGNVEAPEQIVIDEVESEGISTENPVMVQADPDGSLQIGFERTTSETGEVGGDIFNAFTEETGIRTDQGIEISTSETATSSERGSSRTSSENLKINTDELPDAENVRNGDVESSSDSSSGDSSSDLTETLEEIYGEKNIDPQNSDIAEELGLDDSGSTSETSSTSSSSQDSETSNFDRTDYDGAGETTVQLRQNQDQSSSPDSSPSSDATGSESLRKALEEKIQNKEIEVQSRDLDVNPEAGTLVEGDLDSDLDQELDQDLELDQSQDLGQGQEQRNPPREDLQIRQSQDTTTVQESETTTTTDQRTPGLGTTGTSTFSDPDQPIKVRTPGPDLDLDDQDPNRDRRETDPLLGEKDRNYRASLDAVILGITGDEEQYDLGTRPVLNDKDNGEKEMESLQIDTSDDDLSL